MKKLLLFTALISFCFTVNAQESKFGVTAGYQSSSFKVSGAGLDISTDASGYFVGFLRNFQYQKLLVFNQSFFILQFLMMENLSVI